MYLNFIGLAAATATFLGIWTGHVLVRKIEYRSTSLILPTICFALVGLFLGFCSFLSISPTTSAVLGILSMTALWDSYEFSRQQKRVVKGYAPANPQNPRHARILEKHKSAITLDLLKRNPIGREVNPEEAVVLATAKVKVQ